MKNNSYLIPANSKKSLLIMGFFNWLDMGIFAFGVGLSLLLLMLVKSSSLQLTLVLLIPALLSAFLVAPVPNYHNVRTLINNIYRFYTGRKKYYWKGWCVKDEFK